MSVGPRRRDNPIRDWGVQLGIIAGESNGGGVGREQRRQAPGSTGTAPPTTGGGDNSETVHTSETLWTSDPLTVASGRSRLIVLWVRATNVTPGAVGVLGAGDITLATASATAGGVWAQTVPWPSGTGDTFSVAIGWPSAETGTLIATVLDPG